MPNLLYDDLIFNILDFLESEIIITTACIISRDWYNCALKIPLSLTIQEDVPDRTKKLNCAMMKQLTDLVIIGSRKEDWSYLFKIICKSPHLCKLNSLTLNGCFLKSTEFKLLSKSAFGKVLSHLNYEIDLIDTNTTKILQKAFNSTNNPLWIYLSAYYYSKIDYSSTWEYIEKAANLGLIDACRDMGQFCELNKNFEQAYEWFLKAAKLGSSPAQNKVANFLSDGIGVEKNPLLSFEWTMKSALQNDVKAQSYLGQAYYSGENIEKNYREAFKWLSKAVNQGCAKSQCLLGDMYKMGLYVKQDYEAAFRLYFKASKQDNPYANLKLGWLYKNGNGTTQDLRLAFVSFLKSAKKGILQAQYLVGKMYGSGEGVDIDLNESINWLRRAALDSYSPAQSFLGYYYETATGMKRDYNMAFYWYSKSPQFSGDRLGILYTNGWGVEQNLELALKHFSLLKNGTYSKVLFGLLHRYGIYVEKDLEKSSKYLGIDATVQIMDKDIPKYLASDRFCDCCGKKLVGFYYCCRKTGNCSFDMCDYCTPQSCKCGNEELEKINTLFLLKPLLKYLIQRYGKEDANFLLEN